MKQTIINQEILLNGHNHFAARQFSARNTDDHESNERLAEFERACWNGMLSEWFPELTILSSPCSKSFIWSIVNSGHTLCVSIGPCPMPPKESTSIDPQVFLTSY